MNTAFSRDTANKLYVQHRLLQNSHEVFNWLEKGAHFYVCGDAKRMAKDVKKTLQQIIIRESGKTDEDAAAYIKQLVKNGRYQEDTY